MTSTTAHIDFLNQHPVIAVVGLVIVGIVLAVIMRSISDKIINHEAEDKPQG